MKLPHTPLNPLVDRLMDRTLRTDRMMVDDDRRHWRFVLAFDVAMFVGSVAAWTFWPQTRGTWIGVVGGIVVGLQLGRSAIMGVRRASAYRSGWLRGRSQMVAAMVEAQRRGMTPADWLTSELDRDLSMLGLTRADLPADLDGESS